MARSKAECCEHAPVFAVTDMARALDYYEKSLGFEISFKWNDPESGAVEYGILRRGKIQLHLSHSDKQHPSMMYVFVDGIDALCRELKRKKAAIYEKITDQPWDMREFAVIDDDGNRIIFGQNI